MKRVPKAIYLTADEIEERIRKLETSALQLRTDQNEHREIMQEIAKLRNYADAKRWIDSPRLKSAH